MRRLLTIIAFTLLVSTSVYAQQTVKTGTLTVCMEYGYMPFEFKDSKGNIMGFDVDIATGFANSLNLKPEFRDTVWASLIPSVMDGACDCIISGMTITSARQESINFSEPYYASGMVMLVSNIHKGKINSFRDINSPSVTIATKSGTTSARILQTFFKKAKIILSEGETINGAMEVINGRADVFVFDKPYIDSLYNTNPIFQGKAYVINTQFTYEPFGAGFNKSNQALLDSFNRYLDEEKKNGNYKKLYDYWFNSSEWQNR